MTFKMSTHRTLLWLLLTAVAGSAWAQTKIVAPPNKYKPADDVKLGQEASAQVQKELPLLNDASIDEYVAGIGARLVAAIPPEQRYSEFRYTFRVVNQKDINAFALPGGPMYLNRGMIEAAKDEGEIAGVMAHEISHVTLRHGTAQATKGQKFQIGAIAGQVLGAIVGGTAGSIIANGSSFGLNAYFMKFSREYESQADINGAQIMARAGYDPHDMANMFKTLESQGGASGPEWLSSHPNPGNRYQRINQEAAVLKVEGHSGEDTAEFGRVQARLKGMSPALTAEQIAQNQKSGRTASTGTTRVVTVTAPSNTYRTYQPGNALRVSVPSNWQQAATGGSTVTYTPQGAYFQGDSGGGAFTHGVEIGITKGTGNLQRDTNALLKGFAQANPDLRQQGNSRSESVAGRTGITVPLSNVSAITGQEEYVSLATAQLRDGNLLYVIGVAPRTETGAYDAAFRRVRQDLQVSDR